MSWHSRVTAPVRTREDETLRESLERRHGKSDITLRIEAARDAAPIVTRCLFCRWQFIGPAGEGRVRAAEHRLKHPQAHPFKRRKTKAAP
jgi:hypothetical protein